MEELELINAFRECIKKSDFLIKDIKKLYDHINSLYKYCGENDPMNIVSSVLSTSKKIDIVKNKINSTNNSIMYSKSKFNNLLNTNNIIKEKISSTLPTLINKSVEFIITTERELNYISDFNSLIDKISEFDMSQRVITFVIVVYALYKCVKKLTLAVNTCIYYVKAASAELLYLCACSDIVIYTENICKCRYCEINYTNHTATYLKNEADNFAFKYNCATKISIEPLSEKDYNYEMSLLGV